MNPTPPKTEPPPSTPLQKTVSGGSLKRGLRLTLTVLLACASAAFAAERGAARKVLQVGFEKQDFAADAAEDDARPWVVKVDQVRGRTGLAAGFAQNDSALEYFLSRSSLGSSGSLSLWVRGMPGENLWTDKADHTLASLRGQWMPSGKTGYGERIHAPQLWLVKSGTRPVVELRCVGLRDGRYEGYLQTWQWPAVDVSQLDSEAWHQVEAGWDFASGKTWVRVNGRPSAETWPVKWPDTRFFVLRVGDSHHRRFFSPLRGLVDDVILSTTDAAPAATTLKVKPVRIPQSPTVSAPGNRFAEDPNVRGVEAAARKGLDALAQLQQGGGWADNFRYPWLRPHGDPSVVNNGKGNGTLEIAGLYLLAYEVLGESACLEVAQRTGDLLLTAEEPAGVWTATYALIGAKPFEVYETQPKVKLEDGGQDGPFFLLTWLYRLTKDERYRAAALRSAGRVLDGQLPNGAWPQYYDPVTKKPGGYNKGRGGNGGSINDLAINSSMQVMLAAYRLTNERRYLDAIVRAGDWLITAQQRGKAVGWAQQYDGENQPCWARQFEPPALCMRESSWACNALFWVHALTGDKKYLEPIRAACHWAGTTRSDKGWAMYYDFASGEPCSADEYVQLPFDGRGAPNAHPGYTGNYSANKWVKEFYLDSHLSRLAAIDAGQPDPSLIPEHATAADVLKSLIESNGRVFDRGASAILAAQTPDGFWLGDRRGYDWPKMQGQNLLDKSQLLNKLLLNLERVRVAEGKLPVSVLSARGEAAWRAWPVNDPFHTPLRAAR